MQCKLGFGLGCKAIPQNGGAPTLHAVLNGIPLTPGAIRVGFDLTGKP